MGLNTKKTKEIFRGKDCKACGCECRSDTLGYTLGSRIHQQSLSNKQHTSLLFFVKVPTKKNLYNYIFQHRHPFVVIKAIMSCIYVLCAFM